MNSVDSLRAGPLGERRFRLLFLGRTTSFIGNAFATVALAFAVLDLTASVLLVRDVRTIERGGSKPLVEGVDVAGARKVCASPCG